MCLNPVKDKSAFLLNSNCYTLGMANHKPKKARTAAELVQLLLVDLNGTPQGTAYGLAKAAGLSAVAVNDIVLGKRPKPQVQTIAKILAGAGKKWAWLDEVFEPGELTEMVKKKS